MKKYNFLAMLVLCTTLVWSCATEEQPTPKTAYPVPMGIMAMNASIDGQIFNIATGSTKENRAWYIQTLRGWVAKDGKPDYVSHSSNFSWNTGNVDDTRNTWFSITAAPLRITTPDNINASYTIDALVNHFKVGKQTISDLSNLMAGYSMSLSNFDLSGKSKSFSFMSNIGEQAGSKWNITNVIQNGNKFLVTYDIDCKLYSISSLDTKRQTRFVGTLQIEYLYEPF